MKLTRILKGLAVLAYFWAFVPCLAVANLFIAYQFPIDQALGQFLAVTLRVLRDMESVCFPSGFVRPEQRGGDSQSITRFAMEAQLFYLRRRWHCFHSLLPWQRQFLC
jgi:hypothetical protein